MWLVAVIVASDGGTTDSLMASGYLVVDSAQGFSLHLFLGGVMDKDCRD